MLIRTFWIVMILLLASVALLVLLLPQGTQAESSSASIVQLTSDNAINVRPSWSPDDRLIAFQSNRDGGTFHIYVMNADGSNRRALTRGASDDRHPIWMPDGKSILYDSFDGTSREIWMVNVADGNRKQVTRVGALANFPAPSHDGSRISFYVYRDDTLDLWISRIDGSAAKPLTRDLASASNNQCTFACHHAVWSPDSQLLAFSGGDHETIWTIRSDGTDPQVVVADGEHNHFPWFLADGRMGYIHEHVSPVQSWTEAWAYDFKTGKATLLQNQMSPQGPFAWSKDGKKVLFHSPRAGYFQIYLIDLSAPGGINALQGTPVPAQLAVGARTPVAPVADAAVNTLANNADNPIYLVGFGVIVAAGIAGLALVVWRKTRR